MPRKVGSNWGCDTCRPTTQKGRGQAEGLTEVIAEAREAFERITFYQNAAVLQCPACQAYWLTQFWELNTEETKYEEWGEVHRAMIGISPEEMEEIRAADGDKTLAHDRYLDRPWYDFQNFGWCEGPDAGG